MRRHSRIPSAKGPDRARRRRSRRSMPRRFGLRPWEAALIWDDREASIGCYAQRQQAATPWRLGRSANSDVTGSSKKSGEFRSSRQKLGAIRGEVVARLRSATGRIERRLWHVILPSTPDVPMRWGATARRAAARHDTIWTVDLRHDVDHRSTAGDAVAVGRATSSSEDGFPRTHVLRGLDGTQSRPLRGRASRVRMRSGRACARRSRETSMRSCMLRCQNGAALLDTFVLS